MHTVTMEGRAIVLPEWAMNDRDDETKNTHLWIVNRAVDMACQASPLEPFGEALRNFVDQNNLSMRQGLWDADYIPPYNDPNFLDQPTWVSHFYDPDTEENYKGSRFPTALTQGVDYFRQALDGYRAGDCRQAAYYLGLALHYITDVGQPMHAANFTWISSPVGYHTYFEEAVLRWTNQNKPPVIPYTATIESSDPAQFIKEAARRAKPREAILVSKNVLSAYSEREYKCWMSLVSPVIDAALKDIRDVTAQFLALWIRLALSPISRRWIHLNLTSNENVPTVDQDRLAAFYDPSGGGAERIAFADLDGQIHQLVTTNGYPEQWTHTNLTKQTGAPAATGEILRGFASPLPWRSRQIEFTDSKGFLYEMTASPTIPWSWHSITQMCPVAVMSSTAFATEARPGARLLAYVGGIPDRPGDVWCVDCQEANGNQAVTASNLTSLTQAPASLRNALTATSYNAGSGSLGWEQIAFVDESGSIGMIFRLNGASWGYRNLSGLAQAPPADGRLLGSVGWISLNGYGSMAVVYTGKDGHIHEIAFINNCVVHTDLTVAADAPGGVVRTLVAYPIADASNLRGVAYIDEDGLLHRLTSTAEGGWAYTSLTDVTSCPPAGGIALAAYAFECGSGILHRVFFTDLDGELQSLHSIEANDAVIRAPKSPVAVESEPELAMAGAN